MQQMTPRKKVAYDVVKVTNLYEIRGIINELVNAKKPTQLDITMDARVDDKVVKAKLQAPSGMTPHQMLMEGLGIVKARMDCINKYGEAATKVISVDSRTWVDDLIERRFGGKRDGLRIKWVVSDGTYYYDPFTGRLSEDTNE